MLHLYLTTLAAVIAANGLALLAAVALATTRKKWFTARSAATRRRSKLTILISSILPNWRRQPPKVFGARWTTKYTQFARTKPR
jgi:hypothetical protein